VSPCVRACVCCGCDCVVPGCVCPCRLVHACVHVSSVFCVCVCVYAHMVGVAGCRVLGVLLLFSGVHVCVRAFG